MSSEDITLVPDQRIENGLSSPLVFQDDPLRFNCHTQQRRVGDPGPKTRDLGAFIDEKMFIDRDRFFAAQNPDFRRYADCSSRQDPRNWTVNGTAATPSEDDDSDEDDEDDDEEDDDEGDTEVEGLVGGGSKSEIIANNNGGGGNLPSVANGKAHAFGMKMNEDFFAFNSLSSECDWFLDFYVHFVFSGCSFWERAVGEGRWRDWAVGA